MPREPLPELLEVFRSSPQHAGVITDFDGTLAPIVPDPTTSRALDGAVDALHALAATYGTVGVVSGRPAGFLLDRLGGAGQLVVSGLYGLEQAVDGGIAVHGSAVTWQPVVAEAADAARSQCPPEVGVEWKGLSVTLHVRTCPQHADWVATWAEGTAAATGLALHPGRMSWELRPPVSRDKGTVVGELVAGLRAAVFFGDDVGDLPAFDALDRMKAEGAHTLRVGVRSDEAPAELIERADVIVDGPSGVLEVLEALRLD